jgi:hypothetical protein
MADDRLTTLDRPAARRSASVWWEVRYRLTPWWARVLVVFLVSRAATTGILLWFASMQQQNAFSSARPAYLDFAKIWDGSWYFSVTLSGYPTELPLTADGHVAENAWAFMPAYPAVIRSLIWATGLDFRVVSVGVSVAFALATALMLYRLLALLLPQGTTLFAVVLYCFAPLSPILQVAYAESMHAFFLTLALYLLLTRNYPPLFAVVAVMSVTRPSGLAFALALGLHVVHRWVTRARDPFPRRDAVASGALTAFSLLCGFAWPLLAAIVTGSPTAYTDTELAWRAPYIGYLGLQPFASWLQASQFWLPGPLGYVALAVVFAAFAAFLFSPPVRRLGVDLRFWVGSYALYLLAVFFPQSSTFRLLFPVFPLWGAVAQPRSVVYRVSLVVLCLAGQVGWVYIAWWVDGYDWTPP